MEQIIRTPEEILNANQKLYFETLSNTEEHTDKLLNIWSDILPKMLTPKMISVQPFTTPVGLVFFYKYLYTKTESDVPEICLNLENKPVVVKSYKLRNSIEAELDRLILDSVLEEVKKAGNTFSVRENLEDDIKLGSQLVWRKSQRSSAKWLIGNTKILVDKKLINKLPENETGLYCYGENENLKVTIYSDDYFPENELLLGYYGESILDAGTIWSPYQIISPPNFPDKDNFTCSRSLRIRHEVSVVNPNFYQILYL